MTLNDSQAITDTFRLTETRQAVMNHVTRTNDLITKYRGRLEEIKADTTAERKPTKDALTTMTDGKDGLAVVEADVAALEEWITDGLAIFGL